MLDTITELTDEQIVDLQTEIVTEFETVESADPTPQAVENMTALADMLDTVRGEAKRREAQAEELGARAAEAAMRVKGTPEGAEAPADEMPAEEEAPEADAPAEETPAEEEAPEADMPMAKKKPMGEASIATEEVSELSTEAEVTEVIEAETEAEVTFAAETEEVAVAEVAPEAELSVEVTEVSEASTTQESTIAPQEQEGQEATMTAAAQEPEAMDVEVQAPADRRPNIQVNEAAPVAITAGADIPGYTAGSTMKDMGEVAEAMSKRLHGLRRVNGGDGEQHIVASLATTYPEARQLTQDAESNWAKVQAVSGPAAIVASGGHSAPFEVKYDIFGFGTTDRPVRDSLPRFSADRGGIRYIVPPVLSDYGNAVGVWTNATDTNPGTDVKSSLTVTAASETTVATDAVTLQLQFGNLMARAYPELIARHNELALIQHAREAEQYLVSKLTAGSTAVTTTSLIGVARDFLVQIGRAATAMRSRHRLDPAMQLRAIAPAWVKDAMIADLALNMPGDSTLNVATSEIEGYLAARGVNITFSHDLNVYGAQSGSAALNEFADTFTWFLFAEGTFLFLDGGTLDLGIIRDSTLVGTNDYKRFVETFEGIAKVGVESLVVTSTISVNGVAAALRDTTGGATAAAIEY